MCPSLAIGHVMEIVECAVLLEFNQQWQMGQKRQRDSGAAKPPKKKARHGGKKASARKLRFGEKKGVDIDLTQGIFTATTSSNANSVLLNGIQQGTGSWNRIGRKAYLHSIRLRGVAKYQMSNQVTTSDRLNTAARMVVVWDKQPSSGSIPTFDTVFGVTDQTGTESSHVFAPIRYDNMDRFQVLRDCTWVVKGQNGSPTTATSEVIQDYPFDEYIKLGKRETVYSGTSNPTTIADISTGALYVYFRANDATSGDVDWQVASDSTARLRFTD